MRESASIWLPARVRAPGRHHRGVSIRCRDDAVNTAVFNPGWQERLGIDYKDLQLVETGERLTKEKFDRLHAMADPKLVLLTSIRTTSSIP